MRTVIITVDLDFDDWESIRSTVLLGLSYGLKLKRISRSYGGKYHIVFQTHRSKLDDINFYLDAPKELKELVLQRLKEAEELERKIGIGKLEKPYLLRIVLGDDIMRVLWDLVKRPLPEQVLFVKYRWYVKEVVGFE